MAVSSVVILMVLFTSVLQVDGYYFPQFYRLQKALESALTTEETLYTMRQVFFPVVRICAQEIQQVSIRVCVEITIDQALNTTTNDSCTGGRLKLLSASKTGSCNSTFHWQFQWTDSALLSVITIDQLISFDIFSSTIFHILKGALHGRLQVIDVSLPIVCPDMPKELDLKTSLMLLLSWSKSYARHNGVPPQWEETDKGYIQEHYGYHSYYLAESKYNENDIHFIRVVLVISFTLLNTLVLMGVLSYGKQCYKKVHQITSGSTRLAAVTWAFMTTALLMNLLYLSVTLYGLVYVKHPYPKIWSCVVSDVNWCDSVKSTKLYSDEVASLLVKLIVVPSIIVVELIIAVRLTSHTLLPFPCSMATRSQCSFRNGKRVIETVLIWNVMVFIQIVFGVALLPVGILMMIAPVTTLSCVSTVYLLLPFVFIVFIAYSILQWCNPISLKKCCSLSTCAHLFTTVVTLSLSFSVLTLYYSVIALGVEPWSVKGSILSLLPSFLVTPLLWFAKRYFFKKDRATEKVEQNQFTAHSNNSEEVEEEEEENGVSEERKLISVVKTSVQVYI